MRRGTSGMGCVPPCGAESTTGMVPVRMVTRLFGSSARAAIVPTKANRIASTQQQENGTGASVPRQRDEPTTPKAFDNTPQGALEDERPWAVLLNAFGVRISTAAYSTRSVATISLQPPPHPGTVVFARICRITCLA